MIYVRGKVGRMSKSRCLRQSDFKIKQMISIQVNEVF